MPRISDCNHCLYSAHNFHLVCAIHPLGPEGDICSDYTHDSEPKGKWVEDFWGVQVLTEPDEDLWEPVGARYIGGELVVEREQRTFYNGEEIVQPRQRRTREEQLWFLDNHPMFTGRCPECGAAYECDYRAIVHWDCSRCGWMDDSV